MKIQFLLLLLLPVALFSQTEKGATPLPSQNSTLNTQNSTRAVVVGISDYQDNGIPDLQYADRDAEAFAAWLRSPAGGSVSERNLALLTNEKATVAQFDKALGGLIENAGEGDQVIIYFSGHGDVETKTMRQSGFLLCYDSPAATYTAGAYSLYFLKDVVETLSLQNKARVLVITDACHAGKLAGSSVNGTQLTSQSLAQQFEKESKILSCQPNEYSLEGAQWGGGRGLFSFHLVDGLMGLADRNGDGAINLFEIQQYLQSKVPDEAAPHQQIPMIVGDLQTMLAHVDAPTLAVLRQTKAGEALALKGTGMKGWEDDLVAATDSTTQALYYAYKGALEHGALLDTAAGYQSAWALLPQLLQRESLRELHGLLRRNLAAALQDEAQQALNALLDDDPYEANQWQYNPDKYARYPEYLAKSIELLGEQHYMYKTLMAKQLFFVAKKMGMEFQSTMDNAVFVDSVNRAMRNTLQRALHYEPEAAYIFSAIGNTFYADRLHLDSFLYHYNQATALAPTWMLPRRDVSNMYLFNFISSDWGVVEKNLQEALELKPESYIIIERLAWLYQRMGKLDEVIKLCHRMIELRPDLSNGFSTLGTTYLGGRNYELAETYTKKGLETDSSTLDWTVYNLARLYTAKREYLKFFSLLDFYPEKKIGIRIICWFLVRNLMEIKEWQMAEKIVDNSNTHFGSDDPGDIAFALIHKGYFRLYQGQTSQAKTAFQNALLTDQNLNVGFPKLYQGLAMVAIQEQNPDTAEACFQKAINYYPDLLGFWACSEYAEAHYHYARFLLTQNRLSDAETQLLKAEETDPRNPLNYYGMAALHAAQKHDREALDWLAKALEYYYPDYDEIMAEPLFQKIRKTRRFKALMKQYFPDGSDRPKVEALARQYMPEVFEAND